MVLFRHKKKRVEVNLKPHTEVEHVTGISRKKWKYAGFSLRLLCTRWISTLWILFYCVFSNDNKDQSYFCGGSLSLINQWQEIWMDNVTCALRSTLQIPNTYWKHRLGLYMWPPAMNVQYKPILTWICTHAGYMLSWIRKVYITFGWFHIGGGNETTQNICL